MTATRTLQRMIHAGCRDRGLDSEARRDLQLLVTGKASMSDMTDRDLETVIEALKKRGFKPGFKAATDAARARKARPAAPRADLRYIHVLWSLLGKAGALKRPGRDGLNAFVRSRFESKWQSVPIDIDTLRDAGQINDVIRALKEMCARADVEVGK